MKREIIGYLPYSGRKLFTITTTYLNVDSFVPEALLPQFYAALVEAGGDTVATGKRKIPHNKVHEVLALARVRYTDESSTWTRVEPLLTDDVHSDAEDETPAISEDVTWEILTDEREAAVMADQDNAVYHTTLEIARKVKETNK